MTIRKYFLAGVVAFAALLSAAPSFAATQTLCAPDPSGAAVGPKRVVNTSSTAATQPVYILNSQGCANFAQADIGFFLSQGYTPGSSEGTILFTTGVQSGTTDLVIGNLPANTFITAIEIVNATANAVTGGVSIGSTANGTDIVAATACAANCVANSTLVKTGFSTTVSTALHAAAVTAWNSANVTITVKFAAF